jgi:hypothetical protein
MATRKQDRHRKRDRHYLDAQGRVACNPRDREARHRAEMEGIATEQIADVTCEKCLDVMLSDGLLRQL